MYGLRIGRGCNVRVVVEHLSTMQNVNATIVMTIREYNVDIDGLVYMDAGIGRHIKLDFGTNSKLLEFAKHLYEEALRNLQIEIEEEILGPSLGSPYYYNYIVLKRLGEFLKHMVK